MWFRSRDVKDGGRAIADPTLRGVEKTVLEALHNSGHELAYINGWLYSTQDEVKQDTILLSHLDIMQYMD